MHERKVDVFRPYMGGMICGIIAIVLLLFGKWLIVGVLLLSYFLFPFVRYLFGHFDLLLSSLVVNIFYYFKYKQYNMPDAYIGTIDCYVADSKKVFGCCKTLSAVRSARQIYQRYNGKSAYDFKCQNPHWITWKVQIISNVDIVGVPVIPFTNLNQLVQLSNMDTDGLMTVVVLDECNAIMNSRNFKTNFQNEEQVKSIVTCRHNNIYMMLVGQRFEYLDKLIRSLADRVIMCRHFSFLNTVMHSVYSAAELDTAMNPAMVKRLSLKFTYLFKKDYDSYDTKALVDLVANSPSISSTELLERKGDASADLVATRNLSAKGRKLRSRVK